MEAHEFKPPRSASPSSSTQSCIATPVSDAPKTNRRQSTRVTHTKSRRGCLMCKKRKVKCDEKKPSCFNCTRLQEKCVFPGTTGLTPPMSLRSLPSVSKKPNLQDLELLYVYSTATYATLLSSPITRHFWKTTVPRLALESEFLMKEIFALTALHLGNLRPDQRDFYNSVALNHHQVASREALRLLKEVTRETAASLFVFSAITMVIALAVPKRSICGYIPPEEGSFEDWVFLVQGTKHIRDVLGDDIAENPLASMIQFGGERWNLQCPSIVANICGDDMLCELQGRVSSTVKDAGTLRIYNDAINSLRSATCYCLYWESADAFVWIYRCIGGFLPLLQESAQEALAIFAHFSIMVKKLESQWWAQGWTVRIMSEIYMRLDEEHRTWLFRLMEEIGWTPPDS